MPASSGNYDKDIDNLYAVIDSLSEELDNVLADVDDMLASWEEEQATNTNTNSNSNSNPATSDTTRWSVDAWTDSNLVIVEVDSKRIEEEDIYTLYLNLYNDNHLPISQRGESHLALDPTTLAPNYLYYEPTTQQLYKVVSGEWTGPISPSSIYSLVTIREINITFIPKSGDSVIVDSDGTYLDSASAPYWEWDTLVNNRSDGTCKRIETVADINLDVPIPSSFFSNDPEKPYPGEVKLEFELMYN